MTVLAVADEWDAAHGGLSTFNRHLCGGLARAGVRVLCQVPDATMREYRDAAALDVLLVQAPVRPVDGGVGRPELPCGVWPDVVLGHGRVTGPHAKVLAEHHFPSAARVHIVHVAPDELEWLRSGDVETDAGVRAEDRTDTDIALARGAAGVAAVGPRLHLRLRRDLHPLPEQPPTIRLDPGFDTELRAARTPPPGGPLQVLVVGRLHDEYIKGVDLAARFMARALWLRSPSEPEVELLLRGAPAGECATLRERVRAWAGCPDLAVVARPYSADRMRIQQDLARAHLVLLPSRSEGFGLVGAEAITMGTPALISSRSGLGMLLRELLPRALADRVVVEMSLDEERDSARWGHHIAAALRDPAAAFATADMVRRTMAHHRTWAMAARSLLTGLTRRQASHAHPPAARAI